jgi:hypothetical protein
MSELTGSKIDPEIVAPKAYAVELFGTAYAYVPTAPAAKPAVAVPTCAVVGATPLASTNAVVAICVVFVPTVAVGAVGVPVSAGDARDAGTAPLTVVVLPPAASTIALARIVDITKSSRRQW